MQFGVFTIGDITADPTNGTAPTEHQRIKDTVKIARHAEQAGFEVEIAEERVRSSDVARGRVAEMSPPSGEETDAGSTITLALSSGRGQD